MSAVARVAAAKRTGYALARQIGNLSDEGKIARVFGSRDRAVQTLVRVLETHTFAEVAGFCNPKRDLVDFGTGVRGPFAYYGHPTIRSTASPAAAYSCVKSEDILAVRCATWAIAYSGQKSRAISALARWDSRADPMYLFNEQHFKHSTPIWNTLLMGLPRDFFENTNNDALPSPLLASSQGTRLFVAIKDANVDIESVSDILESARF